MRCRLKFRDGKTIVGDVVGEMGRFIIIKDPRSMNGTRIIDIRELKGAWRVDEFEQNFNGNVPKVTYEDPIRVISPEEVDSICGDSDIDLPTEVPKPDFYHEVLRNPDSMVVICESGDLEPEDVHVSVRDRRSDIIFEEMGKRKQLSLKPDGDHVFDDYDIYKNEGVLEIIIGYR